MVRHARHEADKVVYEGIDHKSPDIFRLANQMRKENVDVVGDKPVKNDTGEMSMSEEAKQNAWAEHYERLFNVEFDWDPDHLKDCHEWKLTTVDPQERSTWRSGVRSAMRAASQLPGKGPTDVDDAPAPAC